MAADPFVPQNSGLATLPRKRRYGRLCAALRRRRARRLQGSDGVSPIEFLILVGAADREWLEPHYFDPTINPLGTVRAVVPTRPGDGDSLLDACIAFCPRLFKSCLSLAEVERQLAGVEQLDFHLGGDGIPQAWRRLREEARTPFSEMNIWQAVLTPLQVGGR